ncbi:hypothetical protein HPB50_000670 [Hyalomma asiaticum]|uniref:Uncharacterized protein n=1 Tax=Hyalomma asiaticum TaxID=266040 RepID=A0ACB7T538_HYAAI|nr:hypothetical protein HPB50_000670 [Hyalomma asiaticum]
MSIRVGLNERIDTLIANMVDPTAFTELDITYCAVFSRPALIPLIWKCSGLRCLRCIGCRIRPSDLLAFMQKRLPHLVELEFLLVHMFCVETELRRMRTVLSFGRSLVPPLRRLYVEVDGDHNFRLLSELMGFCPNLKELQVHFLDGNFSRALAACDSILAAGRRSWEKFTFTSELLSRYQGEPLLPSDFTSVACVCSNASYHIPTESWSCVLLRDLAFHWHQCRILPFQLTVVAVDSIREGLTAKAILAAAQKHDWAQVHCLCLLLFPQDPSSVVYPMAGSTYRRSLLFFFSSELNYIVELNVSSFHFAPVLDLAELIEQGRLRYLQSLSASPCALCRRFALERLARSCPDIRELDVRIDTRGRFRRCEGCDGEFFLDPEALRQVCDGRSGVFHRGLGMLSLSNVKKDACLWLIACCTPTATVRISDCGSSESNANFTLFTETLANNSVLRSLVLRGSELDFTETNLLCDLTLFEVLERLYLLSAMALSDGYVDKCMTALSTSLPRLIYIHIHYRSSAEGVERRMSWSRGKHASGHYGDVTLNSPCSAGCSTATFIGLAKPRNRDF